MNIAKVLACILLTACYTEETAKQALKEMGRPEPIQCVHHDSRAETWACIDGSGQNWICEKGGCIRWGSPAPAERP